MTNVIEQVVDYLKVVIDDYETGEPIFEGKLADAPNIEGTCWVEDMYDTRFGMCVFMTVEK